MSVWRSFALSLAFAAAATPLRAEECSRGAETCGRLEFEAGIEAYRSQRWADAAAHFEAAQRLRPHPVVLFNWALAESKLQRYVTALGHFEQVLADPETPKDLLPEVQNEKAQAERNVATLEIDAVEGALAFVDERLVERVARVDPGEHRVRVELDDKTLLDKTLQLRAGERLRLAVDRPKEVVVPPSQPPPAKPPPPPGPSPLWFYVGAGVTAVVGGVTVWSALDTQRAFDDYERDLPGLNQRQADARVAAGHDKELRTNLLIGATALTAAGTAVLGLFVVDWGRDRERGGLYLGPTGLGAVGRF